MSKIKWFALLPVLAAVLVFAPGLLGPRTGQPARDTAGQAEVTEPVWRREGTRTPSLIEVGGALALVLGLALGAITMVRRVQRGAHAASEREIQVKETRRLSPKRALHLVRACDRLLLVSESEHGLHTMADLTPAEPVATDVIPRPEPPPRAADRDDDGAVPRDLLTPRPPQGRKGAVTFRELINRLG